VSQYNLEQHPAPQWINQVDYVTPPINQVTVSGWPVLCAPHQVAAMVATNHHRVDVLQSQDPRGFIGDTLAFLSHETMKVPRKDGAEYICRCKT
jgi:hypothetical protein